MNIIDVLNKHGNQRFVCDGLEDGQAYMMLHNARVYIQANDIEIAEGLLLREVHPLIQKIQSRDD